MKRLYVLLVLFVYNSTIAQGWPTGTSTEVGETKGELTVSLSGASNYNIPIHVAPGINGVVPEIGLNYNSSKGNGIAGYGWDISGVSMISRVPLTRYHGDGNMDPVDFDALDRFALNGELLIAESPYAYVSPDGAVFRTETYSNIKITGYGTSPYGFGYGPERFVVEYPDGSKGHYGASITSRNKSGWALTYWENPQGVRIKYSYDFYDGFFNISNISYGSRLDEAVKTSVIFNYETKQRPEKYYINGELFTQNKVLKQIVVLVGGSSGPQIFSRYELAHNVTSLGYERLSSVTQYSTTGTALNPTTFYYDDTPEQIVYSSATSLLNVGQVSLDNHATASGDYDGDGVLDFILVPTDPSQRYKYHLFNSTNADVTSEVGTYEDLIPVSFLTGTTGNYKLAPKQGWVVIQKASGQIKFRVFNSVPSSGLPTNPIALQYEKVFSDVYVGGSSNKNYYGGDFNGDGLTDILSVNHSDGKVHFINLDKRLSGLTSYYAGTILTLGGGDRIQVADFNGDSKADLFYFRNGHLRIYGLNGNSIYLIHEVIDGHIDTAMPFLLGDYNGDVKIDFLVPIGTGYDYAKFISTGTGVVKTVEVYGIPHQQNTTQNTFHLIPNDINNDGKTDLLLVRSWRNHNHPTGDWYQQGYISVNLYRNVVEGFVADPNMFATTAIQSEVLNKPIPIFLSADKVNKNLELGFITGSKIFHFQSKKDFSKEKLLRGITLGNGVHEKITYSSLTPCLTLDCEEVYISSPGIENFPNFDVVEATGFHVVSKIEKFHSMTSQKQLFKYFGAVTNLEGRGFIGFRSVMRTNWHTDNSQLITNISKFDIAKRGAMTDDYLVLGAAIPSSNFLPSTYIKRTVAVYSDQLSADKIYKLKKNSIVEYNGLEGTTKSTSYFCDDYNNALDTTVKYYKGGTLEQTDVATYEYYNSPSGPNYYIGRPKKKNTSASHNGETLTAEEQYFYNENQLLTQLKKKGHTTDFLTEDNIYDIFGNLTQKTVTAVGLAPRVATYQYSPDGRYLTSLTDIEGLSTVFTYNTSLGLVLSETNPSGLEKTFEYDEWGKETKVTDFTGYSVSTSYAVAPTLTIPSVSNACEITITGDDGSVKKVLYDPVGQEIKRSVLTINDNFSSVLTTYDIYGRKLTVSEPYSGIYLPTHFTVNSYDAIGRLTQTVSEAGKTTSYSYSGLSSTSNDGVKTVTTTKNSLGRTVSITDNGGTINYQHFASGNVKNVLYDGTSLTIKQDGWGRRTELTDPTAGIYKWEYDGWGQVVKEYNPKGNTVYTYNNSGKLIQRIDDDSVYGSITDFVYNPTSKLLQYKDWFDSNGEGHSFYYTYDEFDRVIQQQETGTYATYTRTYTFNNLNQIEFETIYSDNDGFAGSGSDSASITLKYLYKNGFKWKVYDDSNHQLLWENTATNPRGLLTTGTYGNGIIASNTYDEFGFPTQIKHDKSSTNILTLNTFFDAPRGNLTSRSSQIGTLTKTEDFEYDNLDRLTESASAIQGTENQQYDNKGRITSNKMGSYTYDQSKQYQPAKCDFSTFGSTYYTNRVGILNRGMEDGKGWAITSPSTTTFDFTKSKTGIFSMKLSGTGTQQVDADSWVAIDNASPTSYTITGWVWTSAPTARIYLLAQTDAQAATGTFSAYPVNVIIPGSWQFAQLSITLPSNVKRVNARLFKSASGNVWFDDIKIIKSADATDLRRLDIAYNMFKGPTTITETGIDKLNIDYGMSGSRTAMYYGSMDGDRMLRPYRKFYSADGTIEIKQNVVTGTFEFLIYVGGDGYSAPVVYKKKGEDQGYLYLHRDYLGSIVAISNSSGVVVEKRLFDAWGNIFKVCTGNDKILSGLTILDRGFTGHEHLQSVGLINMNGRVYDPMLHRFLQPDNNIQSPFDTQNFNRYSYVLNNPLKYTDPTGEFAFVPVLAAMAYGALIGAAMAVVTYSFTALASGTFSWSGFGKAALMGGIGGAISAGIGAVGTQLFNASSAFIQSGTLNVLSDFTSQVGVSVAFGDPVTAGTLLGSLAGAYIGAQMGNWSGTSGGWLKNAASEIGYGALKGSIRGAVSGFTASAVDGKDFMQGTLYGARNGAIGGAIQSGLMMAIFGPTFKPSDEQLQIVKLMSSEYGVSYTDVAYRKGGLYQTIMKSIGNPREVVWGRNMNVYDDTSPMTFGHEFSHIIQAMKLQGWGAFQMKGIIEQLFIGESAYSTSGTNEYEADFLRDQVLD